MLQDYTANTSTVSEVKRFGRRVRGSEYVDIEHITTKNFLGVNSEIGKTRVKQKKLKNDIKIVSHKILPRKYMWLM